MRKPRRYILIFFLVLSMAVSFYLLNQGDSQKTVSVRIDETHQTVKTDVSTVEELLKEKGIEFEEGDFIYPDLKTSLKEGMEISIEKLKNVTIYDGPNTLNVKSHAKTVKDLFVENKISFDGDDKISHSLDAPVVNHMVVKIDHFVRKVIHKEEEVPFATVRRESSHLEGGKEEVLQKGIPGKNLLTYEEVYLNGKLFQTLNVKSILSRSPVDEIIGYGVEEVVASRGDGEEERQEDNKEEEPQEEPVIPPAEDKPVEEPEEAPQDEPEEEKPVEEETPTGETFIMEATAYAIEGTTASGVPSGPGKVAVDPSVIPLGTKLYIESLDDWPDYGYAVAADTGGDIVGNRIDLFYSSVDTCYNFGRRNVKVTVIHQ